MLKHVTTMFICGAGLVIGGGHSARAQEALLCFGRVANHNVGGGSADTAREVAIVLHTSRGAGSFRIGAETNVAAFLAINSALLAAYGSRESVTISYVSDRNKTPLITGVYAGPGFNVERACPIIKGPNG